MTTQPLLLLENIRKSFGAIEALRDVSFSVILGAVWWSTYERSLMLVFNGLRKMTTNDPSIFSKVHPGGNEKLNSTFVSLSPL